MEKSIQRITKLYLESLSFDALVVLANECGIDVPEGLSRSFLISDLLDVAQEDDDDTPLTATDDKEDAPLKTPRGEQGEDSEISDTCFPTDVGLVFSGPLWALVYWNVGGRDALALSSFFLRINSFDDEARKESVCIAIDKKETERFILLPRSHKYVQVDLVAIPCREAEEAALTAPPLASSAILPLPTGDPLLSAPFSRAALSPIQELSHMKEMLYSHYKDYRYSLLSVPAGEICSN